jgi:hypothetical protein
MGLRSTHSYKNQRQKSRWTVPLIQTHIYNTFFKTTCKGKAPKLKKNKALLSATHITKTYLGG